MLSLQWIVFASEMVDPDHYGRDFNLLFATIKLIDGVYSIAPEMSAYC